VKIRAAAGALLVLAGLAAAASPSATVGADTAASCHYHGSGISAAPDRSDPCTPGMWISDPAIKKTPAASEYDRNVSRAHVCSHGYNPRPGTNVSGPLKRQTLALYGLPTSAGKTTEADHLYPRWLGGATVRQNFWPEPNYTHPSGFTQNPKDRLESKLYHLTCVDRTMTVARARRIFARDWRRAYRRYVSPTITNH
jgi:hypothetical protein